MASPPIPPALIQLAARPFSFYPPIAGIEPNQWILRQADWQSLVVSNTRNGVEITIPRKYVGEFSEVGDPVVIVGLLRELQYAEGEVRPRAHQVIEMPIAVGERVAAPQSHPHRISPAPVIGIRLETHRNRKAYKIAGGAIAATLFLFAVTSNLDWVGDTWQRFTAPRRSTYLSLSPGDTYETVVRKIGRPLASRSSTQNGREYRALVYRRFTALLSPGYIGTFDTNWHPLTSGPELRGIQRF